MPKVCEALIGKDKKQLRGRDKKGRGPSNIEKDRAIFIAPLRAPARY
jgi:hypothetical protein